MDKILCGDAIEVLRTLPSESVNCCVTSPPYYGLRDYGVDGQIGLEQSPAEYIARLVEAFREVRRVLRNDGTLWVVIADSYAGSSKGAQTAEKWNETATKQSYKYTIDNPAANIPKSWSGIKPKDLIGIPWALAFALRDDGWYLRSSSKLSKTNAPLKCNSSSHVPICTLSY
jgi:hypothetical protein